MLKYQKIIVLLIFSTQLFAQPTLVYDDEIYDSNIRTTLLYLKTGENNQMLNPAVSALNQIYPLYCEFDEISDKVGSFYYKIINCNMDWTPNNLIDSEFLKEFMNDQLITTYNLSFNTREKYVHYNFTLPKVKLSGNYLLVVYRNGNADEIVFSKRYIIYEDRISLNVEPKLSTGISERYTHQQIDFLLTYNDYPFIFNPKQEVKAIIRQNYRWDNLLDLKPLYIKENERILDYRFFDLENNFPGGKEFRFFDTRKVYSNSMNIDHVDFTPTEVNVYLMREKERNTLNYLFNIDANGRFVIANNELGAIFQDPDYVNVNFDLKASLQFGDVYVLGAVNNYKPNDKFKMSYDGTTESYKLKTKLKMGYYNYIYGVLNRKTGKFDEISIEGSSNLTENDYEVIIYHRPIGTRSDLVIGYYLLKYNGNQ
ncbi:MAG: DUF5103 domain-containing protein [Bacteroidetes bacterium]|nr:MAG: DUF5103 domain-containing protein [Bacteroidota bacterium]